jgi:hypothetical protein
VGFVHLLLCALLAGIPASELMTESQAAPRGAAALAAARDAYNQGQYAQAIASAVEAKKTPSLSAAAAVVEARAYLERFRAASEPADLTFAHATLASIDPQRLDAADRAELTIGLGLALYFEGRFGAAAELLEIAIADAQPRDASAREKLFDWWATAVDRAAQLAPEAARKSFYARIVLQSEAELAKGAGAPVASYWLAAGARGAGDLDRAWHAAIAAWIRTKWNGSRTAALRADLDQLVINGIIPERARTLAGGDSRALAAAMRAEWEQIKREWS